MRSNPFEPETVKELFAFVLSKLGLTQSSTAFITTWNAQRDRLKASHVFNAQGKASEAQKVFAAECLTYLEHIKVLKDARDDSEGAQAVQAAHAISILPVYGPTFMPFNDACLALRKKRAEAALIALKPVLICVPDTMPSLHISCANCERLKRPNTAKEVVFVQYSRLKVMYALEELQYVIGATFNCNRCRRERDQTLKRIQKQTSEGVKAVIDELLDPNHQTAAALPYTFTTTSKEYRELFKFQHLCRQSCLNVLPVLSLCIATLPFFTSETGFTRDVLYLALMLRKVTPASHLLDRIERE